MYEWRSHTAEIELAVDAGSPEEVFVEAVHALAELISLGRDAEPQSNRVAIEAADLGALLVEWLEELIVLADTESFVPERVDDLRIDETSLTATLVGRGGPIDPLVKAATYHGLRFARDDGVWQARVVLDV
ncbi:MAG: archease [Actinobacteria bacterium]|nr:MAG: archease [Actinomycetota bacterium]